MNPPQVNLVAAWLGILLGFVSGLTLGLFFQRDDWLGGYASLKRRLYRLAHVSFFGLGAVNLFFFFTAARLPHCGQTMAMASWAFIVGAISMPICCCLMAHMPRTRPLFAIPVLSLLFGASLTVVQLVRQAPCTDTRPGQRQPSPLRFPDSPVTHHALARPSAEKDELLTSIHR
jgi:hypothetical protein